MKASRYPSLQVPAQLAPDLRAFLEGVKERLEITTGDRGDPRDRLLTVRDIESAGMATVTVRNKFATLSGGVKATTLAGMTSGSVSSGTFDGVSVPELESLDPEFVADEHDFIVFNNAVSRLQRVPLESLKQLLLTTTADAEITGQWQFQNEEIALELRAEAPRMRLTETPGDGETLDADSTVWDWLLDEQLLQLNLVSDDEATEVPFLELGRDGMDPAFVALMNGAVLQLQDGTLADPGLTFDADINTGLYRIGADRFGLSAGGVLALDIQGTQVGFPSGSAGAPALAPQADPDTGIFSAAANVLGVSTGGAERVRVTTTGVSVTGTVLVNASTGHLDLAPSAAADFAAIKIRNNAATEIWRLNSETDGDLDVVRQSGAGLFRLNGVSVVDATLFTTGTLDDARLSANVPLKNAANIFAAANTFNLTPTVPDGSWTYAKLQNVSATARVLGRATAGAGVIEELTAAQIATLITYTAADVLAKLLTVDGSGSGLDADLLDGLSSAAFSTAVHTHAIADVTGLTAALAAKLDSSSYTAADVLAKLITVDGSGSGLDADMLDGISSAGYLQTTTYQALTPTWANLHTFAGNILLTSANPRLRILETGLAADTGGWDFSWDAGSLAIRTRTDADGAGQAALTLTRPSGTQPLRLFIGAIDADLAGFSTTAGNVNNFGVVFSAFDSTRNANFVLVSAQRPLFNFLKYAGTLSSPTQIVNNTALHLIAFSCYNSDAGAIGPGASVSTTSTENWSATAQGMRMGLSVTANGTVGRVETLRLAELQVQFLDGTVALPSKTYQSDPDTGEYRIGANHVGIATNATLGFAVDGTQRIYGTALHNNSSSPTGTTNQYVASGTYTPTLNNTTNVAASTAAQCQWMRVGNVVTVSGRASVDPTAAGAIVLGISLPLASNFGAVEDCAGVAHAPAIAGQGASISADAANDRAIMEWIAVDLTNQPMVFTFTYEII